MKLSTCFTIPILLLLAWPVSAQETFGWQWPLGLSRDDGGAYRVVLNADVYEHARRADFKDLTVRNGAGHEVPTGVLGPEEPMAAGPQRIDLPFFDLPSDYQSHSHWTISRETRTQGQIRRVESEHSWSSSGPPAGILIDASRVREPILALEMEWPAPEPEFPDPLDMAVVVETSSDLVEWRTVLERGQLVDLQNDGDRVVQNRLNLRGASRYLRVRPLDRKSSIRFTRAAAVIQPLNTEPAWEWKTLQGEAKTADGRTEILYSSPGRYPVARTDIVLKTNSATEWRLESRDSDKDPWRHRAGPWIGFQVSGDVASRSAAQQLNQRTRDRYWRLVSTSPTRDVPELMLGYRPEVVVFLTQEEGPFTLVAGSSKGSRTDAPLERLVTTLQNHFGSHWKPLPAYLGPLEELGGEGAIQEPEESPQWATWLLWAILALGSAFVAGLAIHLLRSTSDSAE